MRASFALALVFGLAFIALDPPLQVPDEPEHFERAYVISQGVLWTDPRGPAVAADIAALSRGPFLNVISGRDQHTSWSEVRTTLQAPQNERRVAVDMMPYASPVPYVLSASTVGLTRALGATAGVSFYCARLVHLLAYLWLCWMAAQLMPYSRAMLVLVMLAPAPLYLAGGISPDPLLCGTTFLFAACVLAGRRSAVATIASLVFSLTKPPYFLISFLALPTKRKWILILPTVAALAFNIAMLAVVSKNMQEMRPGTDISLGRQLGFMLHHPFSAAWTLLLSLRPVWLHHAIGAFGWMDSAVPPVLTASFAVAGLFFGLRAPSPVPSRALVVTAAVLLVTMALSISALLYMSFTAVGAPRVEGLQGRYFVPLAPLVAVLLAAVPVRRLSDERLLLRALPFVLIVMWVAAVLTLRARYW